jgi:hypothetical protein
MGYNSVVAVIKYTDTVRGETFIEHFRSSMLRQRERNPLLMRMDWWLGMSYWREMGMNGWCPEDNINIRHDIVRESEVDCIASRVLSEPLRLDRPPWSIEYLENVDRMGHEFSVCVLKYHHAIADGFTIVGQMMSRIVPVSSKRRMDTVSKHQLSMPVPTLSSFLTSIWKVLTIPKDVPGTYRATRSRFPGQSLVVATSAKPLLLSEVKDIRSNHQTTINDVIVAGLTMALMMFEKSERKHQSNKDLTSVIWTALPWKTSPSRWGNSSLGFVYCTLPTLMAGRVSPRDVLLEIHSRLHALKSSPEALIINGALAVIGSVPTYLGKLVAPLTADAASISFSNMIGPSEKVYWPVPPEGDIGDLSEVGIIDTIHFATSPPFHYGPLVSILSYDGKFYSTISAREDMFSHSELARILDTYLPVAISSLSSGPESIRL